MKTATLASTANSSTSRRAPCRLAAGFQYGDQNGEFDTDFLTQSAPPLYKDCLLSSETCSGDSAGSYDTKEVYAEVLVPTGQGRAVRAVAEPDPGRPLLGLLDLRVAPPTAPTRLTGSPSTTCWSGSPTRISSEPRPSIDIYQAPTADAPTFTDPCIGLTSAAIAANPNLALACDNVAPDGTLRRQTPRSTACSSATVSWGCCPSSLKKAML